MAAHVRGAGPLHTGHCLIDTRSGQRMIAAASTLVRFGTPGEHEIAAYVATGEPVRMAGAFSIDGFGAPFVEGIDGDWGTVVGLSLPLLRRSWPRPGWRSRTCGPARPGRWSGTSPTGTAAGWPRSSPPPGACRWSACPGRTT